MASLPSCFVLQSGGRYLSLTENIPTPNLPSGFLKFDEEQIWSPRTKFVAEPAAGTDGLFHIRSLYNNKYLVTKQIGSKSWIVASAEKPEDDDDDTHQGVLLSTSTAGLFSFLFKDMSRVLVLPRVLAFKSADLNGNYLGSAWLYGKYMYQRFEAGLDIGDQRVANDLFPTADGNYHIKDTTNNKFWKRERGNWIKADHEYYIGTERDNIFSVVHIEDNVVGLRNLGNNRYCGAYTDGGSVNCLNAAYHTLSKETRLILEEVVLKREIKDVAYRLPDSRIYDEQPVEVDHAFGTNNLATDNSMTIEFTTTDSRTTSWNNSVSIQFGVAVEFKFAPVPLIQENKVTLSFEAGYTHEWGGEKTTEYEKKSTYTVTVPPLKSVKATMWATRGKCDVPFSYTQRDLLPSGEWVETRKDDGIFKGINSYNIHFTSDFFDPDDHKATADTK